MTNYQVMPALSVDDYAALKADIAQRGVLVPIEYDEAGNVLDGHHRIRACRELGIPESEWPRQVRCGFTEEEKRQHARQLNLARRHLDRAQKRELIAAQLKETPEKSNRQIAVGLGVSHPTVADVRQGLEECGDVEKFTTSIDKLGREQPAHKPPPSADKARAARKGSRGFTSAAAFEKATGISVAEAQADDERVHQEQEAEFREHLALVGEPALVAELNRLKAEAKAKERENATLRLHVDALTQENVDLKRQLKWWRKKAGGQS